MERRSTSPIPPGISRATSPRESSGPFTGKFICIRPPPLRGTLFYIIKSHPLDSSTLLRDETGIARVIADFILFFAEFEVDFARGGLVSSTANTYFRNISGKTDETHCREVKNYPSLKTKKLSSRSPKSTFFWGAERAYLSLRV